ncbi:MAIN-LIKE 3 [Hibiscus trionum]|nr:MAIN-LIKE 3 [Hibiscus trionum]
MELLGDQPEKLQGGCVTLKWLRTQFSNLPAGANEDVKKAYARAYILQIIGGILVADKTRNKVHMLWLRHLRDFEVAGKLSWGSAVLAFLYRELCRATSVDRHDIGGCLLLLQAWAWFRMPFLRPDLSAPVDYSYPLCLRWFHALSHVGIPTMMHSIRQDIDKKSANEFLWTPYSDSDINECLPNFEPETVSAWTAVVPLIWYAVVEWHPVDRVQRQFGRLQTIPLDPPDFDDLHKITRQGKLEVDWSVKHVHWIAQ